MINRRRKALATKSSLSIAQMHLLEMMQRLNYGRIERLSLHDGQPVFTPGPRIVKDIKLAAADNGVRAEINSPDFYLKCEHIELFKHLRAIGNGIIESIEVKAGLPFRLTTADSEV
jgi:hypothetical protein